MKKTGVLLTLLACMAQAPLQAHLLRWNIPPEYRVEAVRTARVHYLINRKSFNRYEERNIIDLTCTGGEAGAIKVKGVFSVYERPASEKVFNLRDQYKSYFTISPMGSIAVPDEQFMPNLRNIPSFPEQNVGPGEKWQAQAELVLNNFSKPLKVGFPVSYSLRKQGDDASTPGIVDFEYEIDMDLRRGSYPSDFPMRVVGASKGWIKWDLDNNTPVSGEEQYHMVFMLGAIHSGVALHEYRMNIKTDYRLYPPVRAEQKEEQRKELKKEIPEDHSIDVDTNERGLVLRLGEVFFDFDSAALRPRARKNLSLVADIIRRKYPDREIIVEGHTDITGGRDYNFRLSSSRAGNVASFLKQGIAGDKISYRGLGPDRPLADNATPVGRQKNRRVEIIIKLR